MGDKYEFKEKVDTHLVLKLDDVENALDLEEIELLNELFDKIARYRISQRKNAFSEYYIVNIDEPYADQVYDIIMENEMNKIND